MYPRTAVAAAALALALAVATPARADAYVKSCASGDYVGRIAVTATYYGYTVSWVMVDAPGTSTLTLVLGGHVIGQRSSTGSVNTTSSYAGPVRAWYMTADTTYTAPCSDAT